MRDIIPVKCDNCGNKTLYINPGDKTYCLTEECIFQCFRYPTDPERELPVNKHAHNIYVHRLEDEVIAYRSVEKSLALEAKIAMMKEIIGDCVCHEAYKWRQLRDPECLYHDWENELTELQNQLEATEVRGPNPNIPF